MKQINSMSEIDALKKENDMLLVYFGSNTCSVCCDLLPKIDQMLGNYPGISAVKVDIQKSPALSASFSVFTAPAVILFIQGKETLREAGIMSLSRLEGQISRYVELFLAGLRRKTR